MSLSARCPIHFFGEILNGVEHGTMLFEGKTNMRPKSNLYVDIRCMFVSLGKSVLHLE